MNLGTHVLILLLEVVPVVILPAGADFVPTVMVGRKSPDGNFHTVVISVCELHHDYSLIQARSLSCTLAKTFTFCNSNSAHRITSGASEG
jgi:hypothetical protein